MAIVMQAIAYFNDTILMIDHIKRIAVTLINGGVLVYALWLMIQQTIVVKTEYVWLNTLVLIAIVLVAWYILITYGIYPMYHKMQKRLLLVLGVAAIVVGYEMLINDTEKMIYVSDIVRVFGVLTVWLGATGVITNTKAIAAQKRSKNVEIIDA